MNVLLFIAVVLGGGLLALAAIKRMRNPFRSSFPILPQQVRRVKERIEQTSSNFSNLAGNEFPADRTRRGDLQITHARSGYWCILVGQHSVRYSPGANLLSAAEATADLDAQLVVVDEWLANVARQVDLIGPPRPWWRFWPSAMRP